MTALSCDRTGPEDIGQLADVAGRWGGDDGEVEIRIVLDSAEPPAGRLGVVLGPGHGGRLGGEREIRFTGWLGLLRALYEVTAAPGASSLPGA
jgi:hypothetical protein